MFIGHSKWQREQSLKLAADRWLPFFLSSSATVILISSPTRFPSSRIPNWMPQEIDSFQKKLHLPRHRVPPFREGSYKCKFTGYLSLSLVSPPIFGFQAITRELIHASERNFQKMWMYMRGVHDYILDVVGRITILVSWEFPIVRLGWRPRLGSWMSIH